MSNLQAVPQANPEGLPLTGSEETQGPRPSAVKRFFRSFTFGRLFARKKEPGTDGQEQLGNPTEQAANGPEEMHEMQVLPNDTTDAELPRRDSIQEPQSQAV